MPVTSEHEVSRPVHIAHYIARKPTGFGNSTASQDGKPRRADQISCPSPSSCFRAQKLGPPRASSATSLFCAHDDALTGVNLNLWAAGQPHQDDHSLQTQFSFYSIESFYSNGENQVDNMNGESPKRTRAKTPCYYIGQLESQPKEDHIDPTTELADEYQEILPLRISTPSESEHLKPRRVVRKVKGQQSLRAMCHRMSTASIHSMTSITSTKSSTSDSDETLVGSPQSTPISSYFPFHRLPKLEDVKNTRISPVSAEKNDIRFQICLDLLTNELATAFFKPRPAEESRGDSSELQILLMIEAYEALRQDPSVTGSVAEVLDNWLAALYKLYDGRVCSRASSFQSCRSTVSTDSAPALPIRSEQRSGKEDVEFEDFSFDYTEDNLQAWAASDRRDCNS